MRSPSSGDQIWALDERRHFFQRPPAEPILLTTGPTHWDTFISARDGTRIFAEGKTVRGELSRLDARSQQFSPILGGISAEFVSYSADGRFVAYVSYPEGILWKANRDGSNPVQLSDPPMYAINPRWSPDGTEIAFTDIASLNNAISVSYIVAVDSGRPRRLLPAEKGNQWDPNWSPDGRQIVVGAGDLRDPKNQDLRIVDIASHRITVVPRSTGMTSPRWSPDGRHIAALGLESLGLPVFDLQTQTWSALPTKGDVDFPNFSRDSQWIYFIRVRRDQGIWRIRVSGGEEERVIDMKDWHLTGSLGFWLSLDPTDAPLVLRDVGTDDIYALTLSTK
jgi:Tol biopolymer transport system component